MCIGMYCLYGYVFVCIVCNGLYLYVFAYIVHMVARPCGTSYVFICIGMYCI